MVLLDMGGIYDGYCSDITRTFTTNGLTPRQRKLFDAVRRAHQDAIDAVRPGVTAESVDAAARNTLRASGYAENFPHLTGHGIGLSTHEGPIIDENVETVLQPGMVFTIEPGAYVPGVGAARIEDMVLVTESGCEILTDAPRDVN
jgi:Xaa-Pro aminopeptidase